MSWCEIHIYVILSSILDDLWLYSTPHSRPNLLLQRVYEEKMEGQVVLGERLDNENPYEGDKFPYKNFIFESFKIHNNNLETKMQYCKI